MHKFTVQLRPPASPALLSIIPAKDAKPPSWERTVEAAHLTVHPSGLAVSLSDANGNVIAAFPMDQIVSVAKS